MYMFTRFTHHTTSKLKTFGDEDCEFEFEEDVNDIEVQVRDSVYDRKVFMQ